jgi:hypothetical protein
MFDELDGVASDFMIGTWRGGVFHYDHEFGRQLERIDWYGKRFNGLDNVEPLLIRTQPGDRILGWLRPRAAARGSLPREGLRRRCCRTGSP